MAVIMFAFVLARIVFGEEITLVNDRQHVFDLEANNQNALVFVMDVKDFIVGEALVSLESDMKEINERRALLKAGEDSIPTDLEHKEKFEIYSGGSGKMIFEIIRKSKIYIVVESEYSSKFKITLTVTEKTVKLIENQPVRFINATMNLFSFDVKNSDLDYIAIWINKHFAVELEMYLTKDLDQIPTYFNTEPFSKTWSGNFEYRTTDVKIGSKFLIFIDISTADFDAFYDEVCFIMVKTSSKEIKQLYLGTMESGMIRTGEDFNSYFFDIISSDDIATICLEKSDGNGYILISHLENVSNQNFDFSSAYNLNACINVNPEDRKKLGKTSGKYFIKVFGAGIFAYSLVYTKLKSKFHPIAINYPQSGFIYKNLITYYTFDFLEIETKIIIFLEVLTGNSDLYAKVCKTDATKCEFSENEIENPIDIYSSTLKEGNEYIEIAHNPINCEEPSKCSYIIGILGKTEKSHFQLDLTSTGNQFKLFPEKPVNLKTSDNIYFFISNFATSKVIFEVTTLDESIPLYAKSEYSFIEYNNTQYAMINYSHTFTFTRGFQFPIAKWKYTLFTLQVWYDLIEYWLSVVVHIEKITQGENYKLYSKTPIQDLIYDAPDQNYKIYYFSPIFTESEIMIKVIPIFGKVKFSLAKTSEKISEKIDIDGYDWLVPNINFINDSLIFYMKYENPLKKYNDTILVLVEGEEFIFDKSAVYFIEYSEKFGNIGEIIMYPNQGIDQTVTHDGTIKLRYPLYYKYRDVYISISYRKDIYLSYESLVNNTEVGEYNPLKILFWEEYKDLCLHLNDANQTVNQTECYLDIYINFEVYGSLGYIHMIMNDSTYAPVEVKLNSLIKKDRNKYGYYYCDISVNKDLIISQNLDYFVYNIRYRIEDRNKPQYLERPKDILYGLKGESKNEVRLISREIKKQCHSSNCIFLLFIKCTGNEDCPEGYIISQKSDDDSKYYIKIVLWVVACILFMIITLIIYCCQKRIYSKYRKQDLGIKNDVIPSSNIEMQRIQVKVEDSEDH